MTTSTNDSSGSQPVRNTPPTEPAQSIFLPPFETDVCLLWPEWPTSDWSHTVDSGAKHLLSHRSGGHYLVTEEARVYLSENRNEMYLKRLQITSWLVNQRSQGIWQPEITMDLIQSIDPDQCMTLEQATFRLLQHLASYDIGHAFELRDDRALSTKNDEVLRIHTDPISIFLDQAKCLAAAECEEWNQLGVYMDQLESSGYVMKRADPDRPEWNQYSVTFAGHQAFQSGAFVPLGSDPGTGATTNPQSLGIGHNKAVFVVHGRNEIANTAMFDFLKAIGLEPIEWNTGVQLTGEASPYVGQILDAMFSTANATVALLTPDDVVALSEWLRRPDEPPEERTFVGQARPNVLFETGMAMALFRRKTIIVEIGEPKRISDLAGRHTIRMRDTVTSRESLIQRLVIAGCPVDQSGTEWEQAGNFGAAIEAIEKEEGFGQEPSKEKRGEAQEDISQTALSAKAKELITKAATGDEDFQGYIDDFNYRAGNSSMLRPSNPKEVADFEEAREQLIQYGLASAVSPQHMQGRRGLELTARGYRVAKELGQSDQST